MTDNNNMEHTQQSNDESVFNPAMVIVYDFCDIPLRDYQDDPSPSNSEYKTADDNDYKVCYENDDGSIITIDLAKYLPPKVDNNNSYKILDIMDYDEYQLRGGRKSKEEYYASGGMKNVRRHN